LQLYAFKAIQVVSFTTCNSAENESKC
jgi:hypothetical protein